MTGEMDKKKEGRKKIKRLRAEKVEERPHTHIKFR